MNYECSLCSLEKLLLSPIGVRGSLCNTCRTPDCTNPIRSKTVYIFGKPYVMRLYCAASIPKSVVSCHGYIGDSDVVHDAQKDIQDSGTSKEAVGIEDQSVD